MDTKKLVGDIRNKRALIEREGVYRQDKSRTEWLADEGEAHRYINYLIEDNQEKAREIASLREQLDEMQGLLEKESVSQAKQLALLQESNGKLSEIQKDLKKYMARCVKLEKQLADTKARLKFASKNQFGSKRQNVSKKDASEKEVSREQEKDDFDGSDSSSQTPSSVSGEHPQNTENKPVKRDTSNRPETYRKMSVLGEPECHYSDRSKVPGRILESRMVSSFRLDIVLVEEQYEMVRYTEDGKHFAWGYFPKEGHPEVVHRLSGTKAAPQMMQSLAYEVYVKNVTFGLLRQWLEDMGMSVSKNTLRNWLKKGKKRLDGVVQELKELALEKDSIVHCDETWCKVRKYDKYKKAYMWVLVNKKQQVVIFFYEDGSRGRKVLTDFLGDAELKALMSDGYNAYYFLDGELEKTTFEHTEHQVCMAHARAKFIKALDIAEDKEAQPFVKDIDKLYAFERQYKSDGLSPADIYKKRQSEETTKVVDRLHQNLVLALKKVNAKRSEYMTKALNFLNNFWKQLMAYRKDGEFDIDNNIAERQVRPFTTKRKNSLHFGSDDGAEIAAVYHSIISTVKMKGLSAWNYLGGFFSSVVNGETDMAKLIPQKANA